MLDIKLTAHIRVVVEPRDDGWVGKVPGAGVVAYANTKELAREHTVDMFHKGLAATLSHHGTYGLKAYLAKHTIRHTPLQPSRDVELPGVKVLVAS